MTDTSRVDVCYRPLRIGWAVKQGDIDAVRRAIRFSHALWGGRYNPIIVVDHEQDAIDLVEMFGVDLICPIGDAPEIDHFTKKFPHLISPFFNSDVFIKDEKWTSFSYVLDIYNAIIQWRREPEWKVTKESGLRQYHWAEDDPLADVFLIQFGAYPTAAEVGTDYVELVRRAADSAIFELDGRACIPADAPRHPHFATIGQMGVDRYLSQGREWNSPGFFIGSANDFEDIVCHWNLRACDVGVWFVDPNHLQRYVDVIPALEEAMRSAVSHKRHEWDRQLAVWSRRDIEATANVLKGMDLIHRHISGRFWDGNSITAPMMSFGEKSTLGVMGNSGENPRLNFALEGKPFSDDHLFFNQHLVASISIAGALYGNESYTFDVPYVPELNEFYARSMHYDYSKVRAERGRIGLLITAGQHDGFLNALPVADLVQRIFSLGGFEVKLSGSGRIARQLLAQLGGLQGARAFKIPGVRKLIKDFGPRSTFSRKTALNIIADKLPGQATSSFAAHVNLFLEPRSFSAKLAPGDVFSYLVGKGLFRMGMDLDCPTCGMSSWVAVDTLMQRVSCELCGLDYDATRQLLDSEWKFRRSGVLGAERNAQGAVPVVLALQQLGANLDAGLRKNMYSPSIDLKPVKGGELPTCEIDFVWLSESYRSNRTSIILAECKDQGGLTLDEFKRDLDNLRRVAEALPGDRFNPYVLFVKLAPFTLEEIAEARKLNAQFQCRVILLTADELEPYHIYERHKNNEDRYLVGDPDDLARATALLYFGGEDVQGRA
ncbi:hypothetical protein [Dyella sp. 2RAB6]|uniref:hypothetical protein n=1 Tax=Dyella sp. 2RAB6 TaxID=3232992 RepID=UPI003F9122C4